MKAVLIEKPEKMRLIDMPIPECGPKEALIEVSTAGICGSDIEAFYGIRPEPCIKYPVVLGHEFSGIVEKCGAGVSSVKQGDRRFCAAFRQLRRLQILPGWLDWLLH